MSIALHTEVMRLASDVESLRLSLRVLLERIEALEESAPSQEVDIDSLTVKKRGRPPKVAQ